MSNHHSKSRYVLILFGCIVLGILICLWPIDRSLESRKKILVINTTPNTTTKMKLPPCSSVDLPLFNGPSSEMQVGSLPALCDFIASKYDLFDGFVILHGKDTIAYSASALFFCFENNKKAIVLSTFNQEDIDISYRKAQENAGVSFIVDGKIGFVPHPYLPYNPSLQTNYKPISPDMTIATRLVHPNMELKLPESQILILVSYGSGEVPKGLSASITEFIKKGGVICVVGKESKNGLLNSPYSPEVTFVKLLWIFSTFGRKLEMKEVQSKLN